MPARPNNDASRNRYYSEFDGLRFIAAAAVVAFHCNWKIAQGGYLGVDLFFVLSGFLTTRAALSHLGEMRIKPVADYTLRRFCRIWPLLFCVAAVYFPVILFADVNVMSEVISPLFFVANFTVAHFNSPDVLPHFWSLSTEMQFYVFIAVFAVVAQSRWQLALVVAAVFFAVTMGRLEIAVTDRHTAYYHPFYHSSGLLIGAFIGILKFPKIGSIWPTNILVWIALSLFLWSMTEARFRGSELQPLWILAAELLSATMIIAIIMSDARPDKILGSKVMRYLGERSYGIYAWHYPLAVFARGEFEPWQAFILVLSLSILLAHISFHFVEERFRIR